MEEFYKELTYKNYLVNKVENTAFILLSILGIIFIMIRYGVGADYFSYQYIYETLNISSIYHLLTRQMQYEPLFKIILGIFKYFNFSYYVTSNIISTTLFLAQVFWIYRNSKNKFISLVLYFSMFYFVWTLSAIRQGIVLVSSLYLLFDKNEVKEKNKIPIILLLSLIHYSALFLFILLLFNRFNLKKKQITYMLVGSVFISLFPIGLILDKLQLSGPLSIAKYYYEPGLPFLKFGYLIRLLFSLVLLFSYNLIENKKNANNVLFGFSVYFLTSFAPITAGRLSIFTYILIIDLIADVFYNIQFKKIGSLILVLFVGAYFTKEYKAMISQAGIKSNSLPLIMNKEQIDIDKLDYYLLNKRKKAKDLDDNFLHDLVKKEFVGHDTNKYNFIGWNPLIHGYSIYNEEGDLSINYQIKGKPQLYNTVLKNEYDIDSLFKETRYIDVANLGRSDEELKNDVLAFEKENMRYENPFQEKSDYLLKELPLETQNLFPFKNRVTNFSIYKISSPFTYHIIKTNYYHETVYVYLNENLTPLIGLHFSSYDYFDNTNTVNLSYYGKNIHLNKDGDVIWVKQ